MWSDKDRERGRASGAYNLRDVLAQVASAEAQHEARAFSASAPPPVPGHAASRQASGAAPSAQAVTTSKHEVPILPPKGITYAATGIVASVAAIALSHVIMPSKAPSPQVKRVPTVNLVPTPVPYREVATGQLVLTLSSLSKSVLAGATTLPPPDALPPATSGPQLLLSDGVRVRASNVVTGNGGLETSWPIEIVAPGVVLPTSRIVVDGLPAAAKLNHGWLRTDGRWSLALADLPGLSVTMPAAFARAAVTVSLVNESDVVIAQSDAIVEPVPQPEAAPAPVLVKAEATVEDKFNAFVDKWKRYKGRDHMTDAERAALFAEYRTIVEPDARAR